MTLNDAHERLEAQDVSIDTVAISIEWLLKECKTKDIKPFTKLGNEMIQRFFSIYRDWQKIRKETIKLAEKIHAADFKDYSEGLVYAAAADLLVQKCQVGLFEQIVCVAETGELPENDVPF